MFFNKPVMLYLLLVCTFVFATIHTMLTVNDVHFKINEICNEYIDGIPKIDLHCLISELKTTENEIMPHLDELSDRGIITFNIHDWNPFPDLNKGSDRI
jgi:hypothetical protein